MGENKQVSLAEIFRLFLLIGTTGFGGGMAIVALIERYCVHEKHWVTQEEFLHGLAFGQILGPFSLNTCTFIGYRLRGLAGGVTAAVAFMAPSVLLITLLSYIYFQYRQLPRLQSALKGTNPVVIALICVAAAGMARSKVRSFEAWMMGLAAFAAAAFFRVSGLTILLLAGFWSVGRSWYRREQQ